MSRKVEITSGVRYGCLTALHALDERHPSGGIVWAFRCDCGIEISRLAYAVVGATKRGLSPSAGPCLTARQGQHFKKHGGSRHPAYHAWNAAKNRCTNPKHPNWVRYGGRRITFDARWRRFDDFWRDMGSTWARGLTLDRIDNDGPYAPENCRWLPRSAQYMNTRIKLPVDFSILVETLGGTPERFRRRWRKKLSVCGQYADPERVSWPITSKEALVASAIEQTKGP